MHIPLRTHTICLSTCHTLCTLYSVQSDINLVYRYSIPSCTRTLALYCTPDFSRTTSTRIVKLIKPFNAVASHPAQPPMEPRLFVLVLRKPPLPASQSTSSLFQVRPQEMPRKNNPANSISVLPRKTGAVGSPIRTHVSSGKVSSFVRLGDIPCAASETGTPCPFMHSCIHAFRSFSLRSTTGSELRPAEWGKSGHIGRWSAIDCSKLDLSVGNKLRVT